MIRKAANGCFSIMLNVCSSDILEHLLHPAGAWVWIHNHYPQPVIRWWQTELPVSPGDVIEAEVRGMSFDLQLPLEKFRSHLHRFLRHGMAMTQLTQRVPDTLCLERLPEDRLESILLQNGMVSRFFLPHSREVAQFTCTDEDHLRRVCEHEQVAPLILS